MTKNTQKNGEQAMYQYSIFECVGRKYCLQSNVLCCCVQTKALQNAQ